jgi:two-component system response regulator NreC
VSERYDLLIVDDHQLFRETLQEFIERSQRFKNVWSVADVETGIRYIENSHRIVVLLDVTIAERSTIPSISDLLGVAQGNSIHIVVVSMHNRSSIVRAAIESGADGYVAKDSATSVLMTAIEHVISGKQFIDPSVSIDPSRMSGAIRNESNIDLYQRLTPRERELFIRFAHGEKPRDISRSLHISTKTVDAHRYNVFRKLAINSIAELVKLALDIGVL